MDFIMKIDTCTHISHYIATKVRHQPTYKLGLGFP